MYKGNKIAVIVPAYNEESQIENTLINIPCFVDRVYVIDDSSTDDTRLIAEKIAKNNKRITIITLAHNKGVGQAITNGHHWALAEEMDIAAVMAGDNQMDPFYLPDFLDPIVDNKADYTKGNRISQRYNHQQMPLFRYIGNQILTLLTRIASGYWNISDPQNGYTAITTTVLSKMPLNRLYKGFAFENDMLINLNILNARVVDIHHPAIYKDRSSHIVYPEFIAQTSWFLFKNWLRRLWIKYCIRRNTNDIPLHYQHRSPSSYLEAFNSNSQKSRQKRQDYC
jgi:glycosyltransferase involved in cell wall biosynthesis